MTEAANEAMATASFNNLKLRPKTTIFKCRPTDRLVDARSRAPEGSANTLKDACTIITETAYIHVLVRLLRHT
jgi:hypothetical protein